MNSRPDTPTLFDILQRICPEDETILWKGESDRSAMRRRNQKALVRVLLVIPAALLIVAAIGVAGRWAAQLLPESDLGELARAVILMLMGMLFIWLAFLPLLFLRPLFVEGRFVRKQIAFAITENYVLSAYGPGRFHQRICAKGSFQQMGISTHNDEHSSFLLKSTNKNIPDLEMLYVGPSEQVRTLLAAHIAAPANHRAHDTIPEKKMPSNSLTSKQLSGSPPDVA